MKGICLYNNSIDGYVNNLLRFVRVAGASLTAQLLTIISCGSRVYDNIKWSERSSQLMGSDSPVPPLLAMMHWYWQFWYAIAIPRRNTGSRSPMR